jgi:hypothetical protein
MLRLIITYFSLPGIDLSLTLINVRKEKRKTLSIQSQKGKVIVEFLKRSSCLNFILLLTVYNY